MRLPFLQVSQEEMARARTLAGYLGVPYAHALGMTVALKAAALEAAPDGDVSGSITDPNPSEWMAVQCGWPLDRSDVLATALVRCGFAMAGPSGGHAIAGMGPYAKALDTSEKRSEAGRRGALARKEKGSYGRAMAGPQQHYGHGVARDAKTQTQTQKEATTLSAEADQPPGEELPDATDDAQPVLLEVPATPTETPEALQALWNAVTTPPIPKWLGMSKPRRAAALQRLRERSLAEWRRIIERVNASTFCRGENDRGWRADPEFILRPDSADKVLEGKYDRSERASAMATTPKGSPDDERARALREAVAAARAKQAAGGAS